MIELYAGMETYGEGNISWFPDREKTMVRLLETYKPEYIVEIGVNMGHSCKLILDTVKDIKKLYLFDICIRPYVIPNLEILRTHYENVSIEFTPGDSCETLAPFLDKNDHLLDFVEIDGGHSGIAPKLDIDTVIYRMKSNGIIYIDDYNAGYPDINNAINNTNWDNFETHIEGNIFWAIKK